ncbi:MAG: hypothetical protein BWK76_14480 [Desulfobulbaceae bacterium A2]|nr:MAG: hypothetical protein BWK76_14480 [Desulfobulbaceae bacterium A2]
MNVFSDNTLRISELFFSIQGESTCAGLPCAFVRLQGCNLRCRYCDAAYSREEEGGHEMSVAAVLDWLAQYPGQLVEITGGEPLLQPNVMPLMTELLRQGRAVLLETNGSVDISPVPQGVGVILDVKCPDSGMTDRMEWENLARLGQRWRVGARGDEIKFVIGSEDDFFWARQLVRDECPAGPPLLFSPARPRMEPARLAELILTYRLPVRLQLQLHTILWPDRDRGV